MKLRHRVNVETNQKQYKFIWLCRVLNWHSLVIIQYQQQYCICSSTLTDRLTENSQSTPAHAAAAARFVAGRYHNVSIYNVGEN